MCAFKFFWTPMENIYVPFNPCDLQVNSIEIQNPKIRELNCKILKLKGIKILNYI